MPIEGNPALRPDLAWGVDGGREAYFAGMGVVSLGGYARRIDDVTVKRLYRDGAAWVSMPFNQGRAAARGLEFDAKLPLASLLAGAPALDVHADASRHWSRIAAVPGPGNRLDGRLPLAASLGADYRGGSAWSGGVNFTYRPAPPAAPEPCWPPGLVGCARSTCISNEDGSPAGKLRVAVANLLHQPTPPCARTPATTAAMYAPTCAAPSHLARRHCGCTMRCRWHDASGLVRPHAPQLQAKTTLVIMRA
ncbi:TonB-dependent receptor domain-containing protein [Pseudoduganella buxea]|uniref:TonB-dependent receptor domain-containing protein n=1 Tax=Pseudoduganella buxea TaxID=1949069 RepID=UPI0021A804A4|nr:TonB-dependent receptor [Pseudoduganella buxea]